MPPLDIKSGYQKGNQCVASMYKTLGSDTFFTTEDSVFHIFDIFLLGAHVQDSHQIKCDKEFCKTKTANVSILLQTHMYVVADPEISKVGCAPEKGAHPSKIGIFFLDILCPKS
jgi:hypothetical protein